MAQQILDSIISILAFVLIFYNLSIYNVKKTPVQQNWLSTSFVVQLPMAFLCFFPQNIDNLFTAYLMFITSIYGNLYSTKFNITCKKVLIKAQVFLLSLFIPLIYVLWNIELFQALNNTIEIGYLSMFFGTDVYVISIMVVIITIHSIVLIIADFKNVTIWINIDRIVLLVFTIFSGVCIMIKYDYVIWMISKVFVILIDLIILKVIWIDKGRFHNDK